MSSEFIALTKIVINFSWQTMKIVHSLIRKGERDEFFGRAKMKGDTKLVYMESASSFTETAHCISMILASLEYFS